MSISCLVCSDNKKTSHQIKNAIIKYCAPEISIFELRPDALEDSAQQCHPHIVVVSLDRPFPEIMQQTESLRHLYPEAYFVVFIDYKEFTFSDGSISLNRFEYLPKPFRAGALQEAITRTVDQIHRIRDSIMSSGRLESVVNDNIPVIRQHYLSMLLRRGISDAELVKKKFATLQIDCPGPCYTVVIADMPEERENTEYEAVSFLVLGTMKSMLRTEGYQVYIFFDSEYRINCLIGHENRAQNLDIREIMSGLYDYCLLYMDIRICFGIGDAVNSTAQIHESYVQAECELKETAGTLNEHAEELIQSAILYIDQHLSEPKLNLEQVGSSLFFSRSHFSRVFQRVKGEGFQAYLQKRRVEKAKALLCETNLSVQEIAEQTGFSSANYFSTVFKKTENMTPRQFRRKHMINHKKSELLS